MIIFICQNDSFLHGVGEHLLDPVSQLFSRQLEDVEPDSQVVSLQHGGVVQLVQEQRKSQDGHLAVDRFLCAQQAAVRRKQTHLRVRYAEVQRFTSNI